MKNKPECRWIVDENGCWNWQLKKSRGYGMAHLPVLKDKVYVYATNYIMKYGPVPHGHQLDHLCRNRACVNPDHLEPVPQAENLRRGCRTKLTMEKANQIRAEHAEAKKVRGGVKEMAKRWNMDRSYIAQIVRFELWNPEGKWTANR